MIPGTGIISPFLFKLTFIQINIVADRKPEIYRPPKLYSSKTDWTKFSSLLDTDLNNYSQDFSNISDIQTLYSTFTSMIVDNIHRATEPSHSFPSNSKSSNSSTPANRYPNRNNNNTNNFQRLNISMNSNCWKVANKSKIIRNPCRWWNDEYDQLIQNRKKALD